MYLLHTGSVEPPWQPEAMKAVSTAHLNHAPIALSQTRAAQSLERTSELPTAVQNVVDKFQHTTDAKQRYQLLLGYADALPPYPEELKRPENRVMGCSAQVSKSASTATNCQEQQQVPTHQLAGPSAWFPCLTPTATSPHSP